MTPQLGFHRNSVRLQVDRVTLDVATIGRSGALIAESLLCPAGEAQPATAAPESSAQGVSAAINCCE